LLSLLCRGFCCRFGSIPSLLEYTTSWQASRKPQEWTRAEIRVKGRKMM
jgi:hypothetical protein